MRKTLIRFLSIFAVITLLISCDKDDDIYSNQDSTEQGGNNDNNNEEDNISQIVSQNVHVNINYDDYSWKISGTTSLRSVLSGQQIKYKIQCGYVIDDDIYFREYHIDDITYNINYSTSVFIPITEEFATLSIYYDTYLALNNKPESEWTESEHELYNGIINKLEEYEHEAYYNYWGRFVVEIDGKEYIVKKFGLEL